MQNASRLRARPTLWNGVMLRSRLEAGFAQWADSLGLGPEYEPLAFAGISGQYLPDFLLRGVTVEGVADRPFMDATLWVEIKPVMPSMDEFARVEIIHESDPSAILAVAYKDPEPNLWVKRGPKPWREARWSYAHAPYNVGVLIAEPMDRGDMPWPDGYWKGPEA